MADAYTPQTWASGSEGGTPVSAARLNHIETGIEAMDDRLDAIDVDARWTNARTPTSHASTHVAGASDELDAGALGSGAATSGWVPIADGSGGITWGAQSGGTGGANIPVVVASDDAPTAVQSAADYVCDGTADQDQINDAIADAAALNARNANSPVGAQQRGMVLLTGGRFNLSGSILMDTGVTLAGMGRLTELRAVSITAPPTGAGAAVAMIKLARDDVHLTVVRDLYLNGNWASGGDASGIAYDMDGSASADMSTYPSSSPDSDHLIHNLFIDGVKGGTNSADRDGIALEQSVTSNSRGNMVSHCQIRNVGGNGITVTSSSDNHLLMCHVGTVDGNAYHITGGNTKLTNCKSFYSDGWGFYLSANRSTYAALESQDDYQGIYLGGSQCNATGLTIDTPDVNGLQIAASHVNVTAFCVFNRGGGRYATSDNGVAFGTGNNYLLVQGLVGSEVTNDTTGTAGSQSFIAINNGTASPVKSGWT